MASTTKRGDLNIPPDPLQKKRRKGAARLSCAECRRLKLRCDRAIPCSSCVKRGCGAICPDGHLTTGQGNRFVLASTQELHEKISELAQRIRELEDALRASHSQLSSDQHPLLTSDLLNIKAPLQREPPSLRNSASGVAGGGGVGGPGLGPVGGAGAGGEGEDVVDAFGSLSIGLSGRTKYFGQIAGSWYFLQNEDSTNELIETTPSPLDEHLVALQAILPAPILIRAAAFPISHSPAPNDIPLDQLYWYLPPLEKAAQLVEIYYQHAAWMYNPIPRETFEQEVFSAIYTTANTGTSPGSGSSAGGFQQPSPVSPLDVPLSHSHSQNSILSSMNLDGVGVGGVGGGSAALPITHKLSVLFMLLSIGALMDTSQSAYNLEAEKFHQLAKASLFSTLSLDAPTRVAIQALFLMTYYLFLSDRHEGRTGSRWVLMGIAVKMAQSIGLHRDSGKWKGVDPLETQRRRELFWELYTYDSWQCLTFGRPPSFGLAHVDCKMPSGGSAEEDTRDAAYHSWKHRFTSECMSLLHDQAFGAKTPTYATVLQLDRKLRAFHVPPVLQVAGFGVVSVGGGMDTGLAGGGDSVGMTLQRHVVLAMREADLLYLHRSFFARAISDHPKDPLGSPYGTSVIAAYRSAGSLVAMMRNLHTQLREPTERIWFLWTHMFSCAVVLGSIVTRCPSMSLAPSALVQLDSACELFSKAAGSFRANKIVDIMLNLRERAHISLNEFRQGRLSPLTRTLPGTIPDPGSPESANPNDNDELAILGGKTRLVQNQTTPSKEEPPASPPLFSASMGLTRSPTTNNPVVPLPLGTTAQVDPNVLEYLGSFQTQTPGTHGVFGSQPQQTSPVRGGYDDVSVSPVSMFGVSPVASQQQGGGASGPFGGGGSSAGSYSDGNVMGSSYMSHPFSQAQAQTTASSPTHHHPSYSRGMSNGTHGGHTNDIQSHTQSFPQYFPVYDYGLSNSSMGWKGQGQSQNHVPTLEANPTPSGIGLGGGAGGAGGLGAGQRRSSSGSPEGNSIHSTWMEFVASFDPGSGR